MDSDIQIFKLFYPDGFPFVLFFGGDSTKPILIAGAGISYLAVIFNIFILIIFCQRKFLSPATVLMQGLAISDCLAALFTYGFEPVFFTRYGKSKFIEMATMNSNTTIARIVTLDFPYCRLHVFVYQIAECCHMMSALITAAIGIQKAIVIKFPIWSRHNLTKKQSCICCLICYSIAISIHMPVYLSTDVKDSKSPFLRLFGLETCVMGLKNTNLENYVHRTYQVITSLIYIVACLLMVLSSVYTVLSLCGNEFRSHVTAKEKRSVILTLAILLIFLVSEIPRISGNVKYIYMVISNANIFERYDYLTYMLMKLNIPIYKSLYTLFGGRTSHTPEMYKTARIYVEVTKLFTVLACLSNFFIYILMSQKLRTNIILIFKRKKAENNYRKKSENTIFIIGRN